ncbi:MAG: D-alanine--D-alanine ligase, partial [Candidatus Omnitrophica bacterium]|nr:D-alanine--D-alanine ligase [Candidatus Omnitrophota bacterium]
REMTVGILNEKALPVIEICPKRCYFDFTAKYTKGMTDYVVPADISVVLSERLRHIAEDVHRLVGCRMLSRVDFMVDRNGEPLVLEINTIPGFTETSLLPKAAANIGISFEKLCLTLVESAYAKKKETENIACHS